jgi:hypothetical protein
LQVFCRTSRFVHLNCTIGREVFGPGPAIVIFDDGVLEHSRSPLRPPWASASEERGIAQQVAYDDGTAR